MGEFFTSRRNDIGSGLQRAQEAQATAHSRLDEIEKRLASVAAEVAGLKHDAEQGAITDRDKILADAKREVDRVVEQSRQEIDRVARSIERDIKQSVADMVIDRAGKTLQTTMTQDDQKRVVVRFIKEL
jgi:F0F1-type ATP synthase membrane subunit b/b'